MQSAVSPLTVRDLRGAPLGICRAFVSCCISHALLLVDLCGSIALVSESLRILAPGFADPDTRITMNTRNTRNSQSAAYNALSFVQESEEIPPESVSAPSEPSVASTALSSTSVVSPTSPAFLAAVANAVQQVLSAQQAASLPAWSVPTSVAHSGGVYAPSANSSQLAAQASLFAASGAGFASCIPATATPSASVSLPPVSAVTPLLAEQFAWESSVNDGIDPDEFTLHYIKLDQVIRVVSKLGVGALMAKFDVEAAYRNVPVHPSHRVLLGMKWRDQFYVDLVLPFGLRSAPFIFNSIADMVERILVNSYQIPHLLHYLDDFITAGPPRSLQCAQNLATAMEVCQRLGLPLHPGKCVGPSTVLTVLGIELDSYNQVARLPQEKLLVIQSLIGSWLPRKWCNRYELESLIGHLHHAAKVVWPGRTFLRRMIDLLCCFRRRDHPIRLNREFHLDLLWWHQFLEDWHGVSFWLFPGLLPEADIKVSSDAAGAFGYGAYMKGQWFAGSWAPSQELHSIAYKELFPIVLAAHVWGHLWVKKHILFRSDNDAVVHILNTRTSRVPCLMRLLRSLLFSAARHSFSFSSQHVPGVSNQLADALSRFNWQEFRRLAPDAQPLPTLVPPELLAHLTSPP